ncbi:MAG: isoprenoid biosynthesis glyoxalase ElbB [Paludibacter sp.]|nr:isoprenoid biosynthesis glyoxalase ElbB [Paludibacter sp.]
MKKFAIILAGCGVYDGAEIHEAVMSMFAVMKNGAEYQLFAPDIAQHHVVNHLTGTEMPETRNVLVESARIARGKIKPLTELDMRSFDALLFPGGFGVAKNLCSFAFKGADCDVHPQVSKVVREAVSLRKPIGALCISPVILASILDDVEITIGSDKGTAAAVEKMGAKHTNTSHGQVVTDHKHKVFTTPCYMLDATILQIAEGADNIVKVMLKEM